MDIAGLTRVGLQSALSDAGVADGAAARMRASQLWRWIQHHGVTDFWAMTNIAKEVRSALADRFIAGRPEIVERSESVDGTIKWLLRFAPGVEAETVFIPDVGRFGALCVSSQVGCTLNCPFCHTGTQPLVRNLTAGEIVGQIHLAKDDLCEWSCREGERRLTNIVFMGMGEPLYNLDNVVEAVEMASDPEGLAISRRRITVSTSGVVPKIEELGRRAACMLAVSLHAPTDELRNELVPINRRWPIAELLAAIRSYPALSNSRRATFEYVMLAGVNDGPAEARALVRLLAGIPAKINLIPFNPWPGGPYRSSSAATIEAFARIINRAGYASPVRTPRGRDILAACGQLRSASKKPRARERRQSLGTRADA